MAILQTTQAASASRKLILVRDGKEHEVLVEIGPISPVGQNASCHVRIAGEEQEFNQDIYGVDGIQATQLAMTFAGSTLDRIAGKEGSYINEEGHPADHGLGRILRPDTLPEDSSSEQ